VSVKFSTHINLPPHLRAEPKGVSRTRAERLEVLAELEWLIAIDCSTPRHTFVTELIEDVAMKDRTVSVTVTGRFVPRGAL